MLSEPKKIRVRFSKTGSLKFISHLDLNRTIQSAFRRSMLPIWYTQGFNPHPKTVFSLPLSVGTASLCEFMDFRMTEEVPYEEIICRLNASFPEELRVLDAYEPQTKFHDIGWADYEIRILTERAVLTADTAREALSGEMIIEKIGKAGAYTLDIAPLIRLREAKNEGDSLVLMLMLSCDEQNFVNPKYVLDILTQRTSIPGERDDYTICRTEVYFADGITPFR